MRGIVPVFLICPACEHCFCERPLHSRQLQAAQQCSQCLAQTTLSSLPHLNNDHQSQITEDTGEQLLPA